MMSTQREICEAKIIKLCGEFPFKNKMLALKYIDSLGVKICTASDGSRINLSRLSEDQLNKLYDWVKNSWKPIPEEFLLTLSEDEDSD